MEETGIRIQSRRFQGRGAVMGQYGIGEGKKRIYRIKGWPLIPSLEVKVPFVIQYQEIQKAEIGLGSIPLDTSKFIEAGSIRRTAGCLEEILYVTPEKFFIQ
jgi:hypothetical protein